MPSVQGPVHGIGIDVADVTRFDRLLTHGTARFATRWFTRRELDQARTVPPLAAALAARFAVKEAVWKALRVGAWAGPVPWPWIEVVFATAVAPAPDGDEGDEDDEVVVTLHDAVADAAWRVGAGRVRAAVGGAGCAVVIAVALAEERSRTAHAARSRVHYADREVPEPDLGTRTTKGWHP